MATFKNRLIAFGDSIIKGVVMEQEAERLRYKVNDESVTALCSERLGMEEKNYAKFGSTVTMGERIVDNHLTDIQAHDIVLLEYGGNDGDYSWQDIARAPELMHSTHTPLRSFREIYTRMIRKITDIGATAVVLSLPPIDPAVYFRFFSQKKSDDERPNIIDWLHGNLSNITNGHELYNLETLRLACAMQVPWVDITSPFLESRNYRSLLCKDGLHPNAAGQRLIADSITNAL